VVDNITKDRLAFVSGSVLGWAILLATLWRRAAQLDTGATLRFNFDFQDISVGNLISPEPIAFYLLNILVTLGVSVAILSVSYLVAHGLLLASGTAPGLRSAPLARFSRATFINVFRVTRYAGTYLATLFMVFPAVLLQHWLVGRWSIRKDASELVFSLVVCVPAILLAYYYGPRWRRPKRDYIYIAVRLALLYSCYALVSETAYTMTLSSDRTLYSKAANAYVEVPIQLGGATSALADAALEVRNDHGQVLLRPAIHRLGKGSFHACFPALSLSPGEYELRLKYRRASLTFEFPYWHHEVIDSTFFSLVP
jgi:hypothetical protein